MSERGATGETIDGGMMTAEERLVAIEAEWATQVFNSDNPGEQVWQLKQRVLLKHIREAMRDAEQRARVLVICSDCKSDVHAHTESQVGHLICDCGCWWPIKWKLGIFAVASDRRED